VLCGLVPAWRGEPLQRREQGPPEHLVVPLANAELPMLPPEFLQLRHKTITVGLALLGIGDRAKGLEETPSLQVHRGREHGPDFGVHGKQLGVEVCHCRISDRLKQPE
jgi:hypothetical protein